MRSIIHWFIDNPIAANLLMVALLLGGYVGYGSIEKEVFPKYEDNLIRIGMAYPGAASSEVEQQIVVRIEEAIADLPGIFQITSESSQGYGSVSVRVIEGYDVNQLLNDIKGRVDAISTLPIGPDRPEIQQNVYRETLTWLGLYGDVDRRILKNIAYQIRDEMSLLEGVSTVDIMGLQADEVSIEIAEETLRRYQLSFSKVAQAIRQSSLNVPAGTIKSHSGDIQIQTRAQAFNIEDFNRIVVRSDADGGQLLLQDIAVINDGFEESVAESFMNGKPSLILRVEMSDQPLLIEGTENVRTYVEAFRTVMPEGVTLKINFEELSLYNSRFHLLRDNAAGGLFLVFLILMLFLRPLLAFWVVAGIATTFAGAIFALPYFGVSINMLSMFAFLMVLGIVVDDAIIVGESIYRRQESGEKGDASANAGTLSVVKPVSLAVISTVLFFLPMIGVPETTLIYTRSIFYVVLLCLVFSLIESMLILPSHLSHMKPEKPSRFVIFQKLEAIRAWFSNKMENLAKVHYQSLLRSVLKHKSSAYLSFLFMFIIAVTLVSKNWITTQFWPSVDEEQVYVSVEFSEGSSAAYTQQIAQHIRDQVDVLRNDKTLLAKNDGKTFIREVSKDVYDNNSAGIFVGLVVGEERLVSTEDITEKLRDLIGPIPEAQSYSLGGWGGTEPDISLNLNLLDNTRKVQEQAVTDIKHVLEAYPGIINVRSNLSSERTEIDIALKPFSETLGISLEDIANQVRQGFYGIEVQRIPRGKEDVRVMLRYSAAERHSLDTLEQLRIRTDDGTEIPLNTVADIRLVPGTSNIHRIDRQRNININAEVQEGVDAQVIISEMLETHHDEWGKKYAGFKLSEDGNLKEQEQFNQDFNNNFIKVFVLVLALFAIAFRSFSQPFLVMLAVPFGFVGAVFGHLIVGINFSMFSYFGLLACAGVVVNDNLVLLTRINQLRERGSDVMDAVLNAGVDRFRPIVLTSVTTFVGLLPILFERSSQAQFLIPMVISLSFGVVFSSVVTLFLVPSGYYGGHQLNKWANDWIKNKLLFRFRLQKK